MIIIENKEARQHDFVDPRPNKRDEDDLGIPLDPGINEIEERKIDWIEGRSGTKPNACWAWYFKKGLFVKKSMILEKDGELVGDTSNQNIEDLHLMKPIQAAIDFVEATFNREILEEWLNGPEKRKGVISAINDQIAEIERNPQDQ